jgi:hypothetical protein
VVVPFDDDAGAEVRVNAIRSTMGRPARQRRHRADAGGRGVPTARPRRPALGDRGVGRLLTGGGAAMFMTGETVTLSGGAVIR